MSFFTSIADFINYDFLFYSLLGTMLLSVICGILSPLIIAKRYAFMGSAVSHSTLLGISIALSLFTLNQTILVFVTTLLITLIPVLLLAKATYRQTLPSDSLIGIFFTTTMGLGIIIYTLFAKEKGDLLSFLFGNILLIGPIDIFLLSILLIITIFIIIFFLNKWLYIIFDEESALISGLNTQIYHFTFFILLLFVIVTSIKLAGTVLINTLLLIPGFVALKMTNSVKGTLFFSIIFSLATSIFGLLISNWKSLPSGATMSVSQFIFLVLFLIYLKFKGKTHDA